MTGAASGIGRGIAHRLAADAVRRGDECRLALFDLDEDGARSLCAEIESEHVAPVPVTVDLASPSSVGNAFSQAMDHLDGLDALVSNAGVITPRPLELLDQQAWDRDFAVNVRATWLLAQAGYEALGVSRGSIVATASISASAPTEGIGAYGASKAALLMLVKQLAREWGPDGIRCNVVSPGSILTAMTGKGLADPEAQRRRENQIPLRRIGQPADIAAVVSFLLGPDAAYVTGADIPVDGGWAVALMPTVSTVGLV